MVHVKPPARPRLCDLSDLSNDEGGDIRVRPGETVCRVDFVPGHYTVRPVCLVWTDKVLPAHTRVEISRSGLVLHFDHHDRKAWYMCVQEIPQ